MNPHNKNLVGVLLIATSLFLFWILNVATVQKILAYRSAVGERNTQLANRSKILNQIKQENSQIQQRLGDMRRFGAVIPSKKDTAELISAVERLTGASGVLLNEANINEDATSSGPAVDYKRMNVSLKLVGSYQSVLTFLSAVEKNLQLLDVQTIELNPDQQNQSLLNASIQANAYFLK